MGILLLPQLLGLNRSRVVRIRGADDLAEDAAAATYVRIVVWQIILVGLVLLLQATIPLPSGTALAAIVSIDTFAWLRVASHMVCIHYLV